MYDDGVKALTHGPRMPAQKRLLRARLGGLCAVLSYSLSVHPAVAQTQLRVTGTLAIEASATQLLGASRVDARLLDDAGHPVPNVDLRIKPLYTSQVSMARDCRSHTTQLQSSAGGAYLARSKGAGSVCVRFEGAPAHAEFELSFLDTNGLYKAETRTVVADSAVRNVEMAFAPAPSVLPLERESQILSLLTRPTPPLAANEPLETLSLSLSVKRDGQPPTNVGVVRVEIGGTAEFRVSSRALGAPGPIEVSADFPGSETTRAARALTHATVTAIARLALAEPVPASHPESGARVRVLVTSSAGDVTSGSVEARIAGRTISLARVAGGLADLYLQLYESLAKAHPVELRYVADSPWWQPGPPLSVALPILPPNPWRRFAWLAAVVALGSWLLLGWQRPRRLERSAASPGTRPPARVPVDVIQIGDPRSGWRGRVVDAHDGTPIANAVVAVRLPAFDAEGVLQTARCDPDGSFLLEGNETAGPGAALEVRAPFHSPLAAPMPPPGTLILSLTSRRRSLLSRFVEWAAHDRSGEQGREVTPGELSRHADRREVAAWAEAVNEAAFGPEALSETKEQAVVLREPPHQVRKLPQKPDRA